VSSRPASRNTGPSTADRALSETGRTFRQALTLGALSVLVAAAVQFPLVKRFIRGEFRETFLSQTEYSGVRLIALEEAEDLWAGGGAVFFDARPAILYGEGHVPGARNIAADETDADMTADVRDILRERTVVVYCEGADCQSSLHLARRLHDEGFKDIRVLTGGWEEWKKAGLPEERDNDKK
jgi:rhodanese-related sulfurtransferase